MISIFLSIYVLSGIFIVKVIGEDTWLNTFKYCWVGIPVVLIVGIQVAREFFKKEEKVLTPIEIRRKKLKKIMKRRWKLPNFK